MSKRSKSGIRLSNAAPSGAGARELLTEPAYLRGVRRRLREGTLSPSIELELYRQAAASALPQFPLVFLTQHPIGGAYDPMAKSANSQPSTAPATTDPPPEDDGNPDDLEAV